MPSVDLNFHATAGELITTATTHPLPSLLQTPSGLAILEIQGTIHAPFPDPVNDDDDNRDGHLIRTQTPVGRLEFPFYDVKKEVNDTKWMRRVYLYVGKHQRLTGEVKKLPKPLLVVGKRLPHSTLDASTSTATSTSTSTSTRAQSSSPPDEELEVLEVVQYKILFGGRPEPVGN